MSRAPVVLLDLRRDEPGSVGTRVLVVVDADDLARRQPVFAELLSSHLVRSVLCVVVGQGMRLPPALYGESRRVIWVGDPHGIGWELDTGEAFPGPESSAEGTLVDLLGQPEVFDEVVERLGEIPYGVASPGLRVVAGRIDPEVLAQAYREVADRFDEPVTQEAGAFTAPLATAIPVLGGQVELPTSLSDPFVPGGRLDGMFRRVTDHLYQAADGVSSLRYLHRESARQSVMADVVAAGRALAELRDTVCRLFDELDQGGEFDEDAAERMVRYGVKFATPPGMGSEEIVAELRAGVESALAEGRSLVRLAARLRALADRSAPIGSAAFVGDVTRVCPDALLHGLHAPPEFPRGLRRFLLWHHSLGLWRNQLALPEAVRAVGELRTLVARVAVSEWMLAEPRRHTSNAARTLASAIGEICDRLAATLTDWSKAEVQGKATGTGLDEEVTVRLRDRGGQLREVIAGDLFDAVDGWLRPAWPLLEQGAYQDVRVGLDERVNGTMRQYRYHLTHLGVQEKPDFATRDSGRQGLVDAVWRQSPQVEGALRVGPGERMLQLCGDRDLAALERRAHVVRFAPRAVRSPAHPAGVIWTGAGQYAGTLRLVPLRSGAVEEDW
ncbi:hypothetical protein ABT294_22215 [Nonomuraea sp. NPDC000554]|uniref:hypothetical protein n=1 Tax=Nonomuraea sp. NPDC000554 TaxID=3154259 RepID=UPI00331934CA